NRVTLGLELRHPAVYLPEHGDAPVRPTYYGHFTPEEAHAFAAQARLPELARWLHNNARYLRPPEQPRQESRRDKLRRLLARRRYALTPLHPLHLAVERHFAAPLRKLVAGMGLTGVGPGASEEDRE